MLGFGPISLDKVEADTQDLSGRTSVTLTVRGNNIPPLGYVTLNGKAIPTTWKDEHTVTA